MRTLISDLWFAVRSFRRTPVITIVAVAMLALGIGAATATYSVVEGVLLRSLPYDEPDRLVDLKAAPAARAGTRGGGTLSRFSYESVRTGARSFADVAGYLGGRPVLTGMGEPERLQTWNVTSNFFPVLGVQPVLGRGLAAEDDRPGAPPVVVLSHGFWVQRFGADRDVIGRTITLDGVPNEIVGVMPRGMRYPAETVLWRSFGMRLTAEVPTTGNPQGGYWIIARLRDGVTHAQAQADMDALSAALVTAAPAFANWTINVTPLRDYWTGEVRRPLLVMLGAVAFVLLVACANVANLLLSRAVVRRREIAIRTALGATRSRIVRQLLTESVLLSFAGGALGVFLAWRGVPLLVSLGAGELPRVASIEMHLGVLATAAGAMVLTGLLFGVVPALHAARGVSNDALRAGRSAGGTWRTRASDTFVVLQVALTMILLTGAALLGTSFARLVRVDPGFEPDRVLTAQVQLPGARYGEPGSTARFADALLERAGSLPGVQAATVSTGIPFAAGAFGSYSVPGRGEVAGPPATITHVTPGFFRTFGIPLLRGRAFTGTGEDAGTVVVSQELARLAFPGEDPIGKQVTFYGSTTGTIVGVVGATRQMRLTGDRWSDIYTPLEVDGASYLKLSVRAAGDPTALGGALRAVVREVDPLLPVDRVSTVRELISESVARQRFYAVLLGVFAGVTLVMAAAGIFGVAMFAVSQRTHELGIRIALGARSSQIASMVLGRAGALVLGGVVLGIAGALATTRLLAALLFEMTATEPLVFTAVALALVGVALAASWLPARRATRVPPMIALRAE